MNIIFDKTEKTQGFVKISINKSDFQPSVDEKLKGHQKTANIKGFRQGKVPMGMIKRMYSDALIIDAINEQVSEQLNTFLKERESLFLGEPLPVEIDQAFDWEHQESFEFKYQIGFAEPFELKVDKKVKIEKYSINIDDLVINETIENLQRQFGETENPEISSDKDILYGQVKSIEGDINQEISIDLRDVEKDVLKKLIGIKSGAEVEIDAKKIFKYDSALKSQLRLDDEGFKKLKKLTFTLKEIESYKLSPIDQDFFDKTFGKDTIKDESAFRDRVKTIVSQNYITESDNFFDFQVREKLTESAKINLPDEYLKKWLVKTDENITPEIIELEYEAYAKELRWSLIRNQIIKDQDIKIEAEDVINEAKSLIKKQLAGSGMPNQMDDQLDTFADNYLKGENGDNYMKLFNQIQSTRVLDHIKDTVTVKEKTVSLNDFRNL